MIKKLLLIILSALGLSVLCAGQDVDFHIGVQGGLNTGHYVSGGSSASDATQQVKTSYHAGITAELTLPAYFSVQPSVLYCTGGNKSIDVPLSLQWGPDLALIRPFLEVAPMVSMPLSTGEKTAVDKNGAKFSVGFGGGIELWKFQVKFRYDLSDGMRQHPFTVSLALFIF